jgi:spermidine/putrescine-binding protein
MDASDGASSRTEFLKRGGAAVFAFAGTSSLLANMARAAQVAPVGRQRVAATTLKFIGWQGYDGKPSRTFPSLKSWERRNEIVIRSTYISANEEIITKLQATGPGSYDLCSPYHGTVPTLVLARLVEEIPVGELRNWKSITPSLRQQAFLRDASGKVFGVPLGFSSDTPLWNPSLIASPPRSYLDVLKPQFRKKYALRDAPDSNLTAIARALKLGNPDPHHLTKAQLNRVKEVAKRLIDGAVSLTAASGDLLQLLVTKEIAFTLGGTADMVGKAKEQGVTIRSYFPKEGTSSFVDAYCIARGTNNAEQALAWIDAMISPRINAELATVYGGGVVTSRAVRYLPRDLRNRYPYDRLNQVFTRFAPVYPPLPAKRGKYATYADWVRAWEEVKRG